MTWDPSQPTNATKIRKAPSTLQNNWNAIEGGDVPCEKWTLEQRSGNPGTPADPSGLIYTKPNESSQSELWFKNENSDSTRITRRGGIGDYTQGVYGNTFSLASGIDNTQGSFCSAQGRVSSSGTLQADSYNCASATQNSTGNYTVYFSYVPDTPSNWSVVITPRDTSDSEKYTWTLIDQFNTSLASSGFTVKFRKFNPSPNAASINFTSVDVGFCFAVFGGRGV